MVENDLVRFQAEANSLVIADDDEDIRQVLEFTLDNAGYQVTTFGNGPDCWEFLSSEDPPDLLILDVMMPGMSGFEILQRIREAQEMEDIPVIMLTARSREEDVAEGFERGVDQYMTKPFGAQELMARIESILE
jgi:DNA-binding response OmpR family regulator